MLNRRDLRTFNIKLSLSLCEYEKVKAAAQYLGVSKSEAARDLAVEQAKLLLREINGKQAASR